MQLAKSYSGQNILSWFASEKLDGMRAYWDGGASRGRPKSSVAWTSVGKSDKANSICTGLFSRNGNIIWAPEGWLDNLPAFPLDGELFWSSWPPYKPRQDLLSITRRHVADAIDWSFLRLWAFDIPPDDPRRTGTVCFKDNYKRLVDTYEWTLKQTVVESQSQLTDMLTKVDEGLMLRSPYSYWTPKRVSHLLKMKNLEDDECVVIGYTEGLGRLTGITGALRVEWRGLRFELAGMTDAERTNPPAIGSKVTFRYRGLTKAGVPMEARYWRKYSD